MEFLLETSCLARKIKFLFNEETVIFRNAYTLPDWYQPCSVMISSCSRTLKDRNEISSEIAKGFLSHSLTLVSCSQPVPSTALDSLKKEPNRFRVKRNLAPPFCIFSSSWEKMFRDILDDLCFNFTSQGQFPCGRFKTMSNVHQLGKIVFVQIS